MFSPAERRVLKTLLTRFAAQVERSKQEGIHPVINVWEFDRTEHRYLRSALKKLEAPRGPSRR